MKEVVNNLVYLQGMFIVYFIVYFNKRLLKIVVIVKLRKNIFVV